MVSGDYSVRKASYYRKIFDWIAPLYDFGIRLVGLFVGGEENIRRSVLDQIEPIVNSRILELFCGTASLSVMAAKDGAYVCGMDLSMVMLRVARDKSKRERIGVSFVQADAVSIPLRSGVFDRVIVSLGLHEMPLMEIRHILSEIKRVLRKRGILVILDYHKAEGFSGLLERGFIFLVEHDTARKFIMADLQTEIIKAGFVDFYRRFLSKGVLQIVTARV
ncbi:MAG: methyltransferase domain-containing protein [Nitrospinae bacterium]|nr:methyltransferase domain-containing protein [Nitrospinota bacterium]